MTGHKNLLKFHQINNHPFIPKDREFSIENIINLIKDNEDILSYFKDSIITGKTKPRKDYLISVIFTLKPELLVNYVKKIRDQKYKNYMTKHPIQKYPKILKKF